MQINFDKARKLISELEEKLHATSSHTSAAREVLNKWIHSGEAQMRKKSAAALKLVRKKADGFSKALTKLEDNLSRSLDKLTNAIENPAPKSKKKQPVRARSKKGSKVVINRAAVPLAKAEAARKTIVNPAVKGQELRVQANASSRGRRQQAKRDSK